MCNAHYHGACRNFRQRTYQMIGESWYTTNAGKRRVSEDNSRIRMESRKMINTLKDYLESEEFVSEYLQNKANKLIELCDYVLDM